MVTPVHVTIVVNFPINGSYTPGWMKQSLQNVLQQHMGPQRDTACFNSPQHGFDHMRRQFKNIWPDMIQQMNAGIFAPLSLYTQHNVFHGSASRLTMHGITVNQCIGQQWCNGINVIFAWGLWSGFEWMKEVVIWQKEKRKKQEGKTRSMNRKMCLNATRHPLPPQPHHQPHHQPQRTHGTNVFKQKTQGFQDTVLNI